MYGTAVNQLVTVAVFLVLQSIQLAGVSFRCSFAVKYPFFPCYVRATFA